MALGHRAPLSRWAFSRAPLILRAHTGASNIGALENATVCRLTFAQSCAPIIQNATVKRGFWGATFREFHPACRRGRLACAKRRQTVNAPAVPIRRTPTRPWQLFLAPFPLSPLRGKFGQSREKLHLVSDNSRRKAAVGFAASRRHGGSAPVTPAAFEKAGETFIRLRRLVKAWLIAES